MKKFNSISAALAASVLVAGAVTVAPMSAAHAQSAGFSYQDNLECASMHMIASIALEKSNPPAAEAQRGKSRTFLNRASASDSSKSQDQLMADFKAQNTADIAAMMADNNNGETFLRARIAKCAQQ